jgi:dienelactone hydrolase
LPALLLATVLQSPQLPVGQIVPQVTCAAEPSHSYAIYLPAGYTPERTWPIILAFDPGGRGSTPVGRYQVAAERYGFVVVGSNNSRNGSQDLARIVSVLSADVLSRFRIDPRRIYTAGMSGGARVAFLVALGAPDIAGVFASSAGYPDSKPRKSLPFPVFATAGTEDFNHLEMRLLDRELATPHHLAIFEGGHVWLSSDLAIEAVEWMVVQAVKSGRAPRDDRVLDELFAKRMAAADSATDDKKKHLALRSIAADFTGLRDVSALDTRASTLGRSKAVQDALKKDRNEDDRELRALDDIRSIEARLGSDDERAQTLISLRQRWKELADRARKPDDSSDRRLARRVLASLSASATTADPDYLRIISEYRPGRGNGR